MEDSNYIKLHIPGESFWATKLTEDTAKVENILLNGEIGLNDIVKFNPADNEVISVVVKKSNTLGIKYPTEGDIKETYKTIYNYFEAKSVSVEGMFAGTALLSIPVGIPDSTINKIIQECPVTLEVMAGEEDDE